MSRIALLAPFALAALLAGCGSSSTSSSSTAPAPASAGTSSTSAAAGSGSQVALSETEFKITPASAAVTRAGKITITVKNNGKITHALAVQTPSGVVRTGDIAPGASATLTVAATKPGSYVFYCPIDHHRMLGMQGTLVVGGSAASGGGATTSPSTSTGSSGTTSGGGTTSTASSGGGGY